MYEVRVSRGGPALERGRVSPCEVLSFDGCRISRGAVRSVKTIPVVAQRFIACDREQSLLMAPDVREWLPEDHFAWFVLDAVEAMELDVF
jgi:hypothetical protein